MSTRFVKIITDPGSASYTKHEKHFMYLEPTAEEEAALVAEAEKWIVYHVEDTDVSHDEFGDYSLNAKYYKTRLTEYCGDIIIEDGKIWGVVNESRLIKRGEKLVEECDVWESRAVYYYTDTYTIIEADEK